MFGFDKMFDFNRDGHLDSFERAAQFQLMDDMMKHEEADSFDEDDGEGFFDEEGLDQSNIFDSKQGWCDILISRYQDQKVGNPMQACLQEDF